MKKLPRIEPVIVKSGNRKKQVLLADPDMQFELKYDGFRGLLYFDGEVCELISKQGKRLAFPELEKKLARTLGKKSVILDGEVVSLDRSGRPIFSDLLRRKGKSGRTSRADRVTYIAFDVMFFDGHDLRRFPLQERRKFLEKFAKGKIQTSVVFYKVGVRLYEKVTKLDLEGIVAKRLSGTYGPRTEWFKIKNPTYSQEVTRRRIFSRKNSSSDTNRSHQ